MSSCLVATTVVAAPTTGPTIGCTSNTTLEKVVHKIKPGCIGRCENKNAAKIFTLLYF